MTKRIDEGPPDWREQVRNPGKPEGPTLAEAMEVGRKDYMRRNIPIWKIKKHIIEPIKKYYEEKNKCSC